MILPHLMQTTIGTVKFLKIFKDKLIYFSKGKAAKNCSKTLRLVISQNKENGETITLLTKS